MVHTPSPPSDRRGSFRAVLEDSYHRRSLVHLNGSSSVPLLRGSLWLVVRGMVKLTSITVHGDELLLGIVGANEPFGEPLSHGQLVTATTLGPSDLLCLPMGEIEQDPQLAGAMLKAIAARFRQAEALITLLGLRRVEERVRGFLEFLAEEYGQPCDQGLRLDLRLTHQDMASALGTTRVTVTRVLGLLRQEGWLVLDPQRRLVVAPLSRS